MGTTVLIMPDKFKGTLTAAEAAAAIARGWSAARPQDRCDLLPMSDGGDGFGAVLGECLGAIPRTVDTQDAAHRAREAAWWWHAPTRTAILESAQVIGLALLPPGQYHPFHLDTFGLAAALQAAARQGARRCLIGIGGSATNDGGFGLARALGWRFRDSRGLDLEHWIDLPRLERLDPPPAPLPLEELVVAVDVQNPLLGPRGCTRIYGPQKGLKPDDVPAAEKALGHLAETVARQLGGARHEEPGAGAAGGLGFGLRVFAGATLEPGFSVFAEHARVRERMRTAQLVITGEGAIDASTLMGKGVGEVARWCEELRVPCLGLAGCATDEARASGRFALVGAIVPDWAAPADAQRGAASWLEQVARQAGSRWSARQAELAL